MKIKIQRRDKNSKLIKITKKDNKKVKKGIIVINLLFAIAIAISYLVATVATMIYHCNADKVIKIGVGIDAVIVIIYVIAIKVFIKKNGVNKE